MCERRRWCWEQLFLLSYVLLSFVLIAVTVGLIWSCRGVYRFWSTAALMSSVMPPTDVAWVKYKRSSVHWYDSGPRYDLVLLSWFSAALRNISSTLVLFNHFLFPLFTAYHMQRVITNVAWHPARASKQIFFEHHVLLRFTCTKERRQRKPPVKFLSHLFEFVQFHVSHVCCHTLHSCHYHTTWTMTLHSVRPSRLPRCHVYHVLLVSSCFRACFFFCSISFSSVFCTACFFLGIYSFCPFTLHPAHQHVTVWLPVYNCLFFFTFLLVFLSTTSCLKYRVTLVWA